MRTVITNLQPRATVVIGSERKTVVIASGAMGPRGAMGQTELLMSIKGAQVVGLGTIPYPVPFDKTIQYIYIGVGTAPLGAALIYDIKVNGVSIFTVTPKPTILPGTRTSLVVVPDLPILSEGDLITVDVNQVGSSVPGSNATVVIGVAA